METEKFEIGEYVKWQCSTTAIYKIGERTGRMLMLVGNSPYKGIWVDPKDIRHVTPLEMIQEKINKKEVKK